MFRTMTKGAADNTDKAENAAPLVIVRNISLLLHQTTAHPNSKTDSREAAAQTPTMLEYDQALNVNAYQRR